MPSMKPYIELSLNILQLWDARQLSLDTVGKHLKTLPLWFSFAAVQDHLWVIRRDPHNQQVNHYAYLVQKELEIKRWPNGDDQLLLLRYQPHFIHFYLYRMFNDWENIILDLEDASERADTQSRIRVSRVIPRVQQLHINLAKLLHLQHLHTHELAMSRLYECVEGFSMTEFVIGKIDQRIEDVTTQTGSTAPVGIFRNDITWTCFRRATIRRLCILPSPRSRVIKKLLIAPLPARNFDPGVVGELMGFGFYVGSPH
ncbi:hypothetical protein K458DRAFT_382154 [Lentithecium fluviatile CBS 122367]|uniref:Uncharacterized protein n=1 Tax=Lentithecium fluviatile CBS 122367 TaxID=1168545 RepID=A0A6G1JJ59_9PLEO|nr:hypothetical protein K458DRAFT_382154 [Lentithecium fluviatile CBS 122367]